MADPLRAAGGVVVRDGRVLVVHRPKHDDWAFPKGKLEDGETWEDAALREVAEEAGVACDLGPYLGSTRYEIAEGTKEVRFFLMTPRAEARPQNEIDELRWVTREEADGLLTYAYDRQLLKSLR